MPAPLINNAQIERRIDARIAHLTDVQGAKPKDAALCKAAGLKAGALNDIRRNPHSLARGDTIAALAAVLETTPEWLLYGRGPENPDQASHTISPVPLVSWVAASSFAEVPTIIAGDDWPQIHVGDLPSGEFIALRVEGDSMNRIAVHHSIILVRLTDRTMVDRGFYVFQNTDGATFKRFRNSDGPVRLEPYSTNPNHNTLYPDKDLIVIGRVFRVITDLFTPVHQGTSRLA